MVAAINAAVEQGAIKLQPDGEPKEGRKVEFTLLGQPAIAWVRECGFSEISVHAIWQPTTKGRKVVDAGLLSDHNAGGRFGLAVAEGWLERRNGRWLQQHSPPIITDMLSLIGDAKALLAAVAIPAAGYKDHGRFFK
jgi:hypothetical protein